MRCHSGMMNMALVMYTVVCAFAGIVGHLLRNMLFRTCLAFHEVYGFCKVSPTDCRVHLLYNRGQTRDSRGSKRLQSLNCVHTAASLNVASRHTRAYTHVHFHASQPYEERTLCVTDTHFITPLLTPSHTSHTPAAIGNTCPTSHTLYLYSPYQSHTHTRIHAVCQE